MSCARILPLVAVVLTRLTPGETAGQEPREPTIAFRLPDAALVPEGIAYDPVSRRFFITSVYKAKIVGVDAGSGASSDFIAERQHGFMGGLGLAVDSGRRTLWVASAMGSQTRGFRPELDGASGLFRFSLEDDSLTGAYLLDNVPDKHLLNDLAVTSDGYVYVTDTATSAIYVLAPRSDALERWLRSEAIAYPNGICSSGDEVTLFVADDRGIAAVRREDGLVRRLEPVDGIRAVGIDGLYCVDGGLVAVQNHKGLNRVARFALDESQESMTSVEVLVEDHSLFDIPTTGVVVDGALFLIANSQLSSYDASGRLLPLAELVAPVVLRVPLD